MKGSMTMEERMLGKEEAAATVVTSATAETATAVMRVVIMVVN